MARRNCCAAQPAVCRHGRRGSAVTAAKAALPALPAGPLLHTYRCHGAAGVCLPDGRPVGACACLYRRFCRCRRSSTRTWRWPRITDAACLCRPTGNQSDGNAQRLANPAADCHRTRPENNCCLDPLLLGVLHAIYRTTCTARQSTLAPCLELVDHAHALAYTHSAVGLALTYQAQGLPQEAQGRSRRRQANPVIQAADICLDADASFCRRPCGTPGQSRGSTAVGCTREPPACATMPYPCST